MDLLDDDAQPICPACGVTMHPEDGADECRECGHRIPWGDTERHHHDASTDDDWRRFD